MKNNGLFFALFFGGIVWYFSRNGSGNSQQQKMISEITLVVKNAGDTPETKARFLQILAQMSPYEVEGTYRLMVLKEIPQPGTPYYDQITTISTKYNIFT